MQVIVSNIPCRHPGYSTPVSCSQSFPSIKTAVEWSERNAGRLFCLNRHMTRLSFVNYGKRTPEQIEP